MENIDNNEHVPHESPFDHHKMTLKPTSLEKPGIFQQFIKSLIHSNDAVESKISKKVCCHTENANKVQHQLKQIRDELKEEIEDELFPMIAEVINPLLRDVNRIDRMMKRENGELAAIKEYQVWTEGAKLWVELYSKNKDKETIKAAIVKHIINKSMDRIERDIRFIED